MTCSPGSGWRPVDKSRQRDPHIELERLQTMGADVVLLPDEPYPFTPEDGPEAVPGTRMR